MSISQERQAGASGEIEVAPEGVDAGVEELWKWEPGWSDPEAVVKRIVEAVLGVERKAGQLVFWRAH